MHTLFLDTLNACTFTKTGKIWHEGDFYQCLTCDLGKSQFLENYLPKHSICTPCIKTCHDNHEVKYVRYGAHYCYCGEKGEKSCQAQKSKS